MIVQAYDKAGKIDEELLFIDEAARDTADLMRRADLLNNACWKRAMVGQHLPEALADCDASLKLRADGATFDSRALVLFRMGRYGDAIGDYDSGLTLRPSNPHLLHGRGLAELRDGAAAQGRSDIAAAEAADPSVQRTFEGYDLRP